MSLALCITGAFGAVACLVAMYWGTTHTDLRVYVSHEARDLSAHQKEGHESEAAVSAYELVRIKFPPAPRIAGLIFIVIFCVGIILR